MKRLALGLLALAATAVFVMPAATQPPPRPDHGPGGPRPGGPGGRYQLGTVLPPFMRSQLNLTRDQEKQIAALEKEVKSRLNKILTEDQKKQLQNMRPPRGPRPGGPRPEGPPGEGDRPPGRPGEGGPPPSPDRP